MPFPLHMMEKYSFGYWDDLASPSRSFMDLGKFGDAST